MTNNTDAVDLMNENTRLRDALTAKEKECARFARTLKHIADYGDVGSDNPCDGGKYCCRNEISQLAAAALAGGA